MVSESSLAMAVQFAYDVLRFAGAAYLAYLVWQAVRPGARPALLEATVLGGLAARMALDPRR